MQRALLAALVAVLVLPVTAAAAPTARQVATANVRIVDFAFEPALTRIEPGDSVTWTNAGAEVHNVIARVDSPEVFGSADLLPGKTYTNVFAKAGRFAYLCSIHEEMRGVVQVGPDTIDPTLRRPKAKVGRKSVRVSFRLSEPAKVSVFVTKRGKAKKLRKAKARQLADGARSISIKRSGLAPGRYRATVVARDAEGNSGVARVAFKIPAP
jgi:plastocyanin